MTIEEIQKWLNARGFTDKNGHKLVEDNKLLVLTESAVSKFQTKAKSMGLYPYKVDGNPLKYTQLAMVEYDSKNKPVTSKSTGMTSKTVLEMGNTESENIKTLQHKLGLKEDGFYGPVTKTTVIVKQKSLGLLQDGIAGPITLRALGLIAPIKILAGPLQTKLMAVAGSFTAFGTFFNKIYTYYRYGYYFNNKLNLQQEIDPSTPKNCVDLAQLLHALGHEMGYTVRFIGIYCPVDKINHAYIEIKGKELGTVWISADGAAAAKSDYVLGNHWCSGSKTVNPGWIPSEDL